MALLSCTVYANEVCHHTVHRAAAVLGLGCASVVHIPIDANRRMCPNALQSQIEKDKTEKKELC